MNRGRFHRGPRSYRRNQPYRFSHYPQQQQQNWADYKQKFTEDVPAPTLDPTVTPSFPSAPFEKRPRGKLQYVKKGKAELTPTKDTSSDETRADSDVPAVEPTPCLPVTCSFSELKECETILVTPDELREVMTGKGKDKSAMCYMPRVQPRALCPAHLIPLPDFLSAKH